MDRRRRSRPRIDELELDPCLNQQHIQHMMDLPYERVLKAAKKLLAERTAEGPSVCAHIAFGAHKRRSFRKMRAIGQTYDLIVRGGGGGQRSTPDAAKTDQRHPTAASAHRRPVTGLGRRKCSTRPA